MLQCISFVVLPALFKQKICIDEVPAGHIYRQIESNMQFVHDLPGLCSKCLSEVGVQPVILTSSLLLVFFRAVFCLASLKWVSMEIIDCFHSPKFSHRHFSPGGLRNTR